ncbi:hypothetical protein ISCGN_012026 [Ixodes scapularis]
MFANQVLVQAATVSLLTTAERTALWDVITGRLNVEGPAWKEQVEWKNLWNVHVCSAHKHNGLLVVEAAQMGSGANSDRQLDMRIDFKFANRVLLQPATESTLTTAERTALWDEITGTPQRRSLLAVEATRTGGGANSDQQLDMRIDFKFANRVLLQPATDSTLTAAERTALWDKITGGGANSDQQLDMKIDFKFANRVLLQPATESTLTTAKRTALWDVITGQPAGGGGGADNLDSHLVLIDFMFANRVLLQPATESTLTAAKRTALWDKITATESTLTAAKRTALWDKITGQPAGGGGGADNLDSHLVLIDFMFANRVLIQAATESTLTTAERTALWDVITSCLNLEGTIWKEWIEWKNLWNAHVCSTCKHDGQLVVEAARTDGGANSD